MIPVSGGDHGSPLQEYAQLEAYEQTWLGVLPGGSGDGAQLWPESADLPLRPSLSVHLNSLHGLVAD